MGSFQFKKLFSTKISAEFYLHMIVMNLLLGVVLAFGLTKVLILIYQFAKTLIILKLLSQLLCNAYFYHY